MYSVYFSNYSLHPVYFTNYSLHPVYFTNYSLHPVKGTDFYLNFYPSLSSIQVSHTFPFTCYFRAHQTRQSRRNSRPISAEIALLLLQSEIKVALFLFASCSYIANNVFFDKAD